MLNTIGYIMSIDPLYLRKSSVAVSALDDAEYVLGFRRDFVETLTVYSYSFSSYNASRERAISECIRLKTLILELSATGALTFSLFKTLVNLTILDLSLPDANFNLESDDQFPPNNLLHLKELALTGTMKSFLMNHCY